MKHFRLHASLCLATSVAALPWAAIAQTDSTTPIAVGRPHVCFTRRASYGEEKSIARTRVKFTITIEGTVKDTSIVQSSNLPAVDEYAIKCVSKWRYKPVMQGGAPIEKAWEAQINWQVPK